jgi:hypothetical protein
MRAFKILSIIIFAVLLTIATQIGGVILFFSLGLFQIFKSKIKNRFISASSLILLFCSLYLLSIFIVVPFVAKQFARVPLPFNETRYLQPTNQLTFLLCRNYVKPELRDIAYEIAQKMNKDFPGSKINYLEANFPFIDKFPMLPHLSHNDGKKLDLSFYYFDKQSGAESNQVPSFVGYGICEEPRKGEENMATYCEQEGFWQYSLLANIVSQKNKSKYEFDGMRTKALTTLFCEKYAVGMIFIEPHLKVRLGLTNKKIKFHGCQAVRHDDHIHVQLR